MGVNHGRGYVLVPQQFLESGEGGAHPQHFTGEGMAQLVAAGVWRQLFFPISDN